MSTQLHLIRHGETAWSLSHQHTGYTDIPLTPHGESEARELGERLRGTAFAHVLTSPRQRARRTCELAGWGAQAEVIPELQECDYGAFEGERTVEILQTHPHWSLFRDGCPQGESPEQIVERADRLLARLGTLEGDIALFTHGHFGSALAVRWLGLSLVDAQHFPLSTASHSILSRDLTHTGVPILGLWNRTASDIGDTLVETLCQSS